MKKTVIASLAVIGCAAVVATLALGGAGKLGNVQVHADPVEYSVTFDGSESTTVERRDSDSNYAICTTTARGNKLGVVGFDNFQNCLSFCGANFLELQLSDISNALTNNGAIEFSHITGYQISFSGGSLVLKKGLEMEGSPVTSGLKYDVSLTPSDEPVFAMDEFAEEEGDVTISSLTIWYSC